MAIATDLGYLPPNVKAALRHIDVLLIESNHDLEMLRDGPYPWSVKQRVLSRVGHLSNHATGEFLAQDYDGAATCIILGHLSESNNVPELARLAAEQALIDRPACSEPYLVGPSIDSARIRESLIGNLRCWFRATSCIFLYLPAIKRVRIRVTPTMKRSALVFPDPKLESD